MTSVFRDRLIFEDISILENLYADFAKKIALKNDTPAQLAMDYLQSWDYISPQINADEHR